MKSKRIITAILAALILCASVFAVAAEAPARKMISATRYFNGNKDNAGYVKYGEKLTMELRDLTIDGAAANTSDFTFEWYKGAQSAETLVEGENKSSLTITAEKTMDYFCVAYADGSSGAITMPVKVDSINCTLTSTNKIDEENSDDTFFAIEDCKLGQDITFTLNATSAYGNPITYSWKKFDEYIQYVGEELSNTKTLTVNKDEKGFVRYGCMVSDGNHTEDIIISLFPNNTLTETIKLNGVTPERFERGHMIVAKPGDKVDLSVAVKTTNPSFTRRWERVDMTVMGPQATDFGTAETITVIKRDIPDDDYDFEMFECYLDDGNEVFNVGIVLFSLHPYQVTQKNEIKQGTPEVSLDDSTEMLANSLLQKDMEKLQGGQTAEITLSAEEIDKLDKSEQTAVEKVLPANSEIGTCIDINLYKELDGEQKNQITETAGEINLSIEVPKEMLNQNSQAQFTVTRIHDGVAQHLDCVYNAETKKVSFKTDKFSTYVLSTVAPKAADGKSPATSDSIVPVAAVIASLLAVAYSYKKCTIHNA